MPLLQRCPNCGETHDVSVYVSGQRVPCRRCALRFEVVRNDVSNQVESTGSRRRLGAGPSTAEVAVPFDDSGVIALVDPNSLQPEPFRRDPSHPPPPIGPIGQEIAPTQLAGGPAIPPPLPISAAPVQLPGFELLNLLGRGGMGEVWRARQRSLGREVAVKILSRDLAKDRDFVRRFELEASALTTISHPHVVAIIDRGRHDGVLFFAMELVTGQSLRERITKGPLPLSESARLMGQVLSAIGHAHGKGIIHRDLKPENVLVDGQGTAKVADFGLAAIAGATGEDRITRSSVAMGTLSYMAPEQRKDAHGVDCRADVYSAGVVLYELLTGDVPTGRYEPPSRKRDGIPRAVDRVLDKALAPEPHDRFQTAAEMGNALLRASGEQRPFWARLWAK